MAEKLIKLESAFRGLGDEEDDGKSEDLPLDEGLEDEKTQEDDLSDEEEEEF